MSRQSALRIAMIGTRGMPATYGGIERAVEELSVRLAARGHDVTVYCRLSYCAARVSSLDGVRLRYLPAVPTKHLEAITHTAFATADAVSRKFDVIHYHGTGPALLAPFAKIAGKRVVATVQGLDHQRAKWGGLAAFVLRLGAWSCARFPAQTIVVSRVLQEHYRSVYGRDVCYIPNGVNLPTQPLPTPAFDLEPDRYFLFLGRLVPEKAVHLLISAYKMVGTDMPLVIAGPTSYTDDYVEHLRRLAATDARVRLVGPVYGEEKEGLLANARAFCQPSELEGLPIALLEAMSYGRPAVASNLPEHLEIVDERSGYLFARGNATALATALGQVARDPVEARKRGQAARRAVSKRYTWDSIVDDVEAVYTDVCRRRAWRPARTVPD